MRATLHLLPRRAVAALATCVALVMVGATGLVQAQTRANQTLVALVKSVATQELGAVEQREAVVRESFASALSREQALVLAHALAPVLTHEQFAPYAAHALRSRHQRTTTRAQLAGMLVEVAFFELPDRGTVRLGAADQLAFLDDAVKLLRSMPAAACKAVLNASLDAPTRAALEKRYMAEFSLEAMARVALRRQRAALAELTQAPTVLQPPSRGEAELAREIHKDEALRAVGRKFSAKVVQRVFADMSQAAPAELCGVLTAWMDATRSLPEPYRTWEVLRFWQSEADALSAELR